MGARLGSLRPVTTPLSVYSTWGLHDELGDDVHLTEELATGALARLEQWKESSDLSFDVFHLDCFWFDRNRGYDFFDPAGWPDGPDRFFDRVKRAGMVPGLWYSTNGSWLDPVEWRDSKSANNWDFSLIDGPYAPLFEESILRAAREWGVRFFKFDFAAFATTVAGVERPNEEAYSLGLGRFRQILRRLKKEYPDAHVITHCGFSRQDMEPPLCSGRRPGTDLGLLEVVDAVFTGDPRPGEIPQTSLTRSIDLLQDRQVWLLHQEGFPLHRIEDHGVFAASTNTAQYRKRQGFTRSHIGQLARGARRDLFYGDPSLLSELDVRQMAQARDLYFEAFQSGLETHVIADGEPGTVPMHAYLTGGGSCGYLWAVNSTLTAQQQTFTVVNLGEASVLFTDASAEPAVQVQRDLLTLELPPESAVLIGLGDYAGTGLLLAPDPEDRTPFHSRLLSLTWRPTPEGLMAELPPVLVADEIVVLIQVTDAHNERLPGLATQIGQQNDRNRKHDTILLHDMIPIEMVDADGKPMKPRWRLPDVPVYAGMSWLAVSFDAAPGARVNVANRTEPRRRIVATALAVDR